MRKGKFNLDFPFSSPPLLVTGKKRLKLLNLFARQTKAHSKRGECEVRSFKGALSQYSGVSCMNKEEAGPYYGYEFAQRASLCLYHTLFERGEQNRMCESEDGFRLYF